VYILIPIFFKQILKVKKYKLVGKHSYYCGKLSEELVRVDCRLGNNRYCGLCCYETEMILCIEDVKRIESLGFHRNFFVRVKGGLMVLRNMDGHCVFLDVKTGKCKIYPYRPLGCRLYPIVYNVVEERVEVDNLCPKAHLIPRENLVKFRDILLRHLRKCGLMI